MLPKCNQGRVRVFKEASLDLEHLILITLDRVRYLLHPNDSERRILSQVVELYSPLVTRDDSGIVFHRPAEFMRQSYLSHPFGQTA